MMKVTLTRERVESLRRHFASMKENVEDSDTRVGAFAPYDVILESVALCDHYLSTPAAEPTAGDARADDLLRRIAAVGITGADFYYLLAEVRMLREMVRAERERCAKVVPTTWLDPMFHTDDTPPLDGLSVEWVCKRIAAAIRASSPEGSPDGSPEGEGGRET